MLVRRKRIRPAIGVLGTANEGEMTQRVTEVRLVSCAAFLSIAVLCRAMQANAGPAELDDWCAQASQPSSIALCSDPELRELAIQRNHAFEAARVRLGKDAYDALLREQKTWVRSYSTACGISPTVAPPLPLSRETLDCMKQAGQARVDYLWTYNGAARAPAPRSNPAAPLESQIASPRFIACADQDWGCKSVRLSKDMTEQSVISAMGYLPNKVEMHTCGSSTPNSWSCKIFTFGSLYQNITIIFEEGPTGWMVNSWSVYP
jgi:uncharacterized protein YecT (DUF1311 family)